MKNEITANSIRNAEDSIIAGAKNQDQLTELNENAANSLDSRPQDADRPGNYTEEKEMVTPEAGTDLGGITNLSLDELKDRGDNND